MSASAEFFLYLVRYRGHAIGSQRRSRRVPRGLIRTQGVSDEFHGVLVGPGVSGGCLAVS